MPQRKFYNVYQKGFLIGTLSLLPEQIKNLERRGFIVKERVRVSKNATRARKTKTRVRRSSNPGGLVKIYQSITRIEGTKGKDSAYPGQKFFHNFSKPYPSMYGSRDRKKLVIK